MPPKSLLLLLIFFSSFSAYAQLKKGNRMVGLTVASGLLSKGETELSGPNQTPSVSETGNFTLQLTPSVGWFLTDNAIVGASITVGLSDQTVRRKSAGVTYMEDNYNNIDFGAGTFFRYYFQGSSAFRPFTHLFFTAGSGTTNTDGFYYFTMGTDNAKSTYDGKSSGRFFYNAGINAGVTRLLSPNTGVDLFVGYLRTSNQMTTKTEQLIDYTSPSTPDTRSSFENTQKHTSNGVSFGIGFQVFLTRK